MALEVETSPFVSAINPFEELCLLKALVERCPMSPHGGPGVLRPSVELSGRIIEAQVWRGPGSGNVAGARGGGVGCDSTSASTDVSF